MNDGVHLYNQFHINFPLFAFSINQFESLILAV